MTMPAVTPAGTATVPPSDGDALADVPAATPRPADGPPSAVPDGPGCAVPPPPDRDPHPVIVTSTRQATTVPSARAGRAGAWVVQVESMAHPHASAMWHRTRGGLS